MIFILDLGVTYLISKWDSEVTECWIYKGPFLKPAPKVVQKLEEAKHNLLEIKEWESLKDHDHINGNYRGPAHDTCNKKLQIGFFETKVLLICHNLQEYDSHLLMKVMSKFTADKLNCISENIGKYKAINVDQL
ncbi:hypothetical protein RhiirB3_431832 [Rhizophagus irregularis]|nr:hypothetical protein RhiirB3_431832 [Rhizophagus irregularis]